jgi:hypothetical protein
MRQRENPYFVFRCQEAKHSSNVMSSDAPLGIEKRNMDFLFIWLQAVVFVVNVCTTYFSQSVHEYSVRYRLLVEDSETQKRERVQPSVFFLHRSLFITFSPSRQSMKTINNSIPLGTIS